MNSVPERVESNNDIGTQGLVRIALVQSVSRLGSESYDPRIDNLESARTAIHEAVSRGAEVVVFGELFLNGYRSDEWLHRWAVTTSASDPFVSELTSISKSHGIELLVGAATTDAPQHADVHNTVIVAMSDGSVEFHHKAHVASFPYGSGLYGDGLSHLATEGCYYSAGREIRVAHSPRCSFGVHVCYDIAFPEVARSQLIMGADVLINVAAALEGFESYWDVLIPARALENATYYCLASVVGTQRDNVLFGGSRVVAPDGHVIASAQAGQEEIILAELDLRHISELRRRSRFLAQRNPSMYSALTESPH